MAIPTQKAEGIDQFLTDVLGIDRRGAITSDTCSWCKGPATEFRNAISQQEYRISGFCQKCQDDTFGVD